MRARRAAAGVEETGAARNPMPAIPNEDSEAARAAWISTAMAGRNSIATAKAASASTTTKASGAAAARALGSAGNLFLYLSVFSCNNTYI